MGNQEKSDHHDIYINVMEILIAEEVDRHLKKIPERIVKYIKRSEVETFALNRLPALYASSEKGLKHQRDRATQELKPQIVRAVQQAFAAIQNDPLRLSQPLQRKSHDSEAEAVLQALKEWLKSPDLTWETALRKIQKLQHRTQANRQTPQLPSEDISTQPTAAPSIAVDHTARPGTYGSHTQWKRHQRPSGTETGFEDSYLR